MLAEKSAYAAFWRISWGAIPQVRLLHYIIFWYWSTFTGICGFMQPFHGPLFTKWQDVLRSNLVIPRNHESLSLFLSLSLYDIPLSPCNIYQQASKSSNEFNVVDIPWHNLTFSVKLCFSCNSEPLFLPTNRAIAHSWQKLWVKSTIVMCWRGCIEYIDPAHVPTLFIWAGGHQLWLLVYTSNRLKWIYQYPHPCLDMWIARIWWRV